MSELFDSDRVLYVCSCGFEKPISRIYFCRHCVKLRCGNCVSHEVDSHYCPNCLENMPSAEARVKKNRCANCFDCPCCKHTLSTRATSIQVPNAEDSSKLIPKKVYYLACGFCRWTSRDAGLKDQNVASGGWQEPENFDVKRINSLLEHYRALALQEKLEKEQRKFTRKRHYVQFSTDKYSLSTVVARKRAGLPPISGLSLKVDDYRALEIDPAEATEEVVELPAEYLTDPVNLPRMSSVIQMLSQVELQPKHTPELYPKHKHLLVKRSQRCRECEHNLSKPEFNPTSIKFKIQLAAYYHVPNVRIMTEPTLIVGKECQVIVTLTNPTQSAMHVSMKSDEFENDALMTAKVELPADEVVLAPRDDTAEFDDLSENMGSRDNPKEVAFRKANKVGVYVNVTPLQPGSDIRWPVVFSYDYLNTMPQAQSSGDPKEPQLMWLEHRIVINFGSANSRIANVEKTSQ